MNRFNAAIMAIMKELEADPYGWTFTGDGTEVTTLKSASPFPKVCRKHLAPLLKPEAFEKEPTP